MHDTNTRTAVNAALVIAARELRERSRLFLVAGAMALIPFATAFVPGAGGERGTVIATVAGALAVAYACSIALMQGVTIIGRDLSEKRLTFFFSKPVPPWTIWAGKAAAALLTTAVAGAMVAIPAFLLSPSRWAEVWAVNGRTVLLLTIVLCLAVFFAGHAVSTMFRSRSILIAVDAVLGAATLGAMFLIVRPLFVYHATWLWGGMLAAMGGVILAILAIVPAGQLARGRADARRSHVALSRLLWPAVAVVLALGAGATLWLTSGTIASFDGWGQFDHSPSGRWVFVSGSDRMRGSLGASFLVNTATRKAERLDAPSVDAAFSRDGQVAAWHREMPELPQWRRNEADRRTWHREGRIVVRSLEPGAKATLLPAQLDWSEREPLLSDDGSRVLVVGSSRMRTFDAASGKLLGAAQRHQNSRILAAWFATPSRIRLLEQSSGAKAVDLFEWNLGTRTITRTGQVPVAEPIDRRDVSVTADGTLLYLSRDAKLVDAVTGTVRATLPLPVTRASRARMLADGTIVVMQGSKLHIFDRAGRSVREIALPRLAFAVVTGQLGDDRALLFGGPDEKRFGGSMYVVNVRTGIIEKTMPRLVGPRVEWTLDPRLTRYPADATFASTDYRKLIYWSLKQD